MFVVEAFDRILFHTEAIDIENNEYVLWDATGQGVSLSIDKGRITDVSTTKPQFPLSEAFQRFVAANDLSGDFESADSLETWNRIQKALAQRPKKPGLLSRLFRHSRER